MSNSLQVLNCGTGMLLDVSEIIETETGCDVTVNKSKYSRITKSYTGSFESECGRVCGKVVAKMVDDDVTTTINLKVVDDEDDEEDWSFMIVDQITRLDIFDESKDEVILD